MINKLALISSVIAIAAAQTVLPSVAQEFPTEEPVKIVVAVPAGGQTDTLARITADFLQRRLDQAVIVENRPGAGSTIGADYVAKSDPDGYTLLMAGAEQAMAPAVRTLPYDFEDFTFLVRGFTTQPLILANPALPVSSLSELVQYMKDNPGRVRYGTTGVGAFVHMGTAMIEASAGVKGVHIPYPGIAPVYTDLLAGNIDVTFGGSVPFPDGIKVLGTSGSKRSAIYPDLPTLEEVGVTGASVDAWYGLLAPPNLPQPIADRLITELTAIFKDPEAIAKYQEAAKATPETNPLVGEDFKAQALQEEAKWRELAKRENIVVQQ
jgi:tripartite-type tricarboxylate transporter receptor subunit TctC